MIILNELRSLYRSYTRNEFDIIVENSNENTLTKDGDTTVLRTNEKLAYNFGIFEDYKNKFQVKSNFECGDYYKKRKPILPNLILTYAFEYILDGDIEYQNSRISTGIIIKRKYNPEYHFIFKVYYHYKLIRKFCLRKEEKLKKIMKDWKICIKLQKKAKKNVQFYKIELY